MPDSRPFHSAVARRITGIRMLCVPALIFAIVAVSSSFASAQKTASLTKSQAIQATIQALGENGGKKARLTLRGLVSGTIDMKRYDKFAAVTALNEIVESPDDDDVQFLVRAVTEPDTIRPIGRGTYTAKELRQDATTAIANQGTVSVRTALAGYITTKVISDETRRAVQTILWRDLPRNIPAQAILYASPNSDASSTATFGTRLLRHNQQAMAALLGIPQVAAQTSSSSSSRGRPSRTATKQNDELDVAVTAGLTVKAVWNAPFTKAVASRISTNSYAGRQMLPLLASIPISAARKELHERLKTHASAGPVNLGYRSQRGEPFGNDAQPQFGADWDDPGSLLVLKSIPRTQPPATSKAAKTKGRPIRRRVRRAPANPKHDWFDAVAQNVAAWNERAFLASFTADKAGRKPLDKKSEGWLLAPFAGTEISGWQRLQFPHKDQTFSKGIEVPPLKLEYYRAEGVVDFTKVTAHYRKVMAEACKGKPELRKFPYQLWLEGAVESLPTKRRRCIDVVLKRLAPTIGSKGGEMPERVRVEVLVIEIADYR